jgi:hypothetical protein
MEAYTIALFGEAERGEYQKGYFFHELAELVECLGHPPPESHGLFFAVQSLLFHRDILFFRVKEEGYSRFEYLRGLDVLREQRLIPQIAAIALPGVGDEALLDAVTPVCAYYHSILISTEADLYDYLTRT